MESTSSVDVLQNLKEVDVQEHFVLQLQHGPSAQVSSSNFVKLIKEHGKFVNSVHFYWNVQFLQLDNHQNQLIQVCAHIKSFFISTFNMYWMS